MNQDDKRQKLIETLKKFDTVMVITDAYNGTLHGRPMAVAELDTASGEVWFVTSRESEKTREVEVNARALVTGQASTGYVSVSGRIDVVDDRRRIDKLWSDAWRVWFPKGKDDPDLTLMRLRPDCGEYWNAGGVAGMRYLFEAAKALVTGERPHAEDPAQHGKVRMG